ncbi:MAG: Asp/Glu racemase [Rhodospirillaceae bacterium]|jgi:maleate isomerase|nr:Asp/Glu racemase [Rhodospirillaceae bacterium]MBT4045629.1 Asp/Glu racemase [Rhodospirillaceae bacterium]MBT4686799.1 Asp/Glu racemase [Rhodospirillaceae bacterium]MBT5082414.1 Asp/Glu racemase [Rhodospirillaceae bacterium]MBT5524049.1 Asp/Glu racemase [Rhodospirillaceae bacterium]
MKLPFTLDSGIASKAAFGVIILQADETLEAEFRTVFNHPGWALYHSRIPSAPEVTPTTLQQMEADMPDAAALLPGATPLDVVAYACTSGATVIGTEKIAAIIRGQHPKAATTDPISATIAACAHLGVKKLGFITPYIAEVSDAMRALLEANGLSSPVFASFEQIEEAVVARISTQSVCDAICQTGQSDQVDAVFASCTNLRSFEILDEAETLIGKPVITSNQALAWHMLHLAGQTPPTDGPGRLFRG